MGGNGRNRTPGGHRVDTRMDTKADTRVDSKGEMPRRIFRKTRDFSVRLFYFRTPVSDFLFRDFQSRIRGECFWERKMPPLFL